MIHNANLEQIEKKAYRSTFHDGLWDIFWGLLILGFALSPWLYELGLGRPWNTAVVMLPAPIILVLGKKYITIPRLGLVEFGARRKSAQRKLKYLIAASVAVPLLLILFLLADIVKIGLGPYAAAVSAGLFLVMILSLIAYFLDYLRLYFYAWLFALSLVGAEYLADYLGPVAARLIVCGLAALAILIIGLKLLK